MENTETKSKKLAIILLVAIIIILGCLCVLFATGTIKLGGDKKSEESNNTSENTNNVVDDNTNENINENVNQGTSENNNAQEGVVTEELDKSIGDELMTRYFINAKAQDASSVYFNSLKQKGLTDSIKLQIVIDKLESEGKVYCEDAFDVNYTQGGAKEYRRNGSYYGCDYGMGQPDLDSYSYTAVNNKYKELFNAEAPKANSEVDYEYSTKLNKYVTLWPIASGSKTPGTLYGVTSVKRTGDKLTVEAKYLDYTRSTPGFAYTIGNSQEIADNREALTNAYQNNYDKLPVLKLEFESINGKYILVKTY